MSFLGIFVGHVADDQDPREVMKQEVWLLESRLASCGSCGCSLLSRVARGCWSRTGARVLRRLLGAMAQRSIGRVSESKPESTHQACPKADPPSQLRKLLKRLCKTLPVDAGWLTRCNAEERRLTQQSAESHPQQEQ